MRFTTISAVLLSCLLLAGCDNDPSVMATGPDVRSVLISTTSACDAELGRDIRDQQNSLFKQPTLNAARAAWKPVTDHCVSIPSQAKEEMLAYVQFTINAYDSGKVEAQKVGTTKEGALVAHWDSVFTYVGYPAPNLPVSVLGAEGAVGVITQATTNRELKAAHAAVTVPVSAQQGVNQPGRLISIYPITSGACLAGTNLTQHGACFDFTANPAAPKFSDKVKVGICQALNAQGSIPGNVPALGHLQDAGNTTVTGPTGIYPDFCPHDGYVGSWTGGFSGIATRLAWLTGRAFGLQTAYAANGGLGGLDDDLSSPFGNMDLLVFKATFTANALGSTIVTGDTADVGTWTAQVTNPGSITVQGSLGDLTDTLVVLSQGGGNCVNCGGLLLQGNLASAGPLATTGKYHVEFWAVQDLLHIKSAPFVLRDAAGTAEIARVTFSTVSGNNILSYNGTPVGTWVRQVAKRFEIVVDLDADTTSLAVDGVPVASGHSFTASNFASIAADYRGIDSGVMGWDNITVTRLTDQ